MNFNFKGLSIVLVLPEYKYGLAINTVRWLCQDLIASTGDAVVLNIMLTVRAHTTRIYIVTLHTSLSGTIYIFESIIIFKRKTF
jgi:hypothetical protein